MRFPKITGLDRDQAKVYQGAPVEGTIMVIGPPGTGKTVVAFHRAHHLQGIGQSPHVLMYNKVLARYTAHRDTVALEVDVRTFHSWVSSWWRRMTNSFRPPSIEGDPYAHDWEKIQGLVVQMLMNGTNPNEISWGHLVIDEGQDFPAKMYATLHSLMLIANAKGATPPAAITVLADENQRLQPGRNATLEDIRQSLGLHEADRNVFKLKKNYRNTREIAAFASHFYVGLASGQPDLPNKGGSVLPTISLAGGETAGKNWNAFVDKIARYAKSRRTEEIGVLVPSNDVRKTFVNRLKSRLSPEGIEVQSYASNDNDAKAEDLVFDTPGHVTVINLQSAKGLEFDAVFIIDPGAVMMGAAELNVKMTLYVMCSRARSFLNLMLVKDPNHARILSWLPKPTGNYTVEELI